MKMEAIFPCITAIKAPQWLMDKWPAAEIILTMRADLYLTSLPRYLPPKHAVSGSASWPRWKCRLPDFSPQLLWDQNDKPRAKTREGNLPILNPNLSILCHLSALTVPDLATDRCSLKKTQLFFTVFHRLGNEHNILKNKNTKSYGLDLRFKRKSNTSFLALGQWTKPYNYNFAMIEMYHPAVWWGSMHTQKYDDIQPRRYWNYF